MTVVVFFTNVLNAVGKVLSNGALINLFFAFFALAIIATVPCIVRWVIHCFR